MSARRRFARPPHGAGRHGGHVVAGCRLLALTLLGVSIAAGAAGADLRVMTFNLRYGTAADGDHRWPLRAAAVVQAIAQADPDLLGTQECLSFQRDELLAALPGYAVVAHGRDDGLEVGEMCASFYRDGRFLLLDRGTFWLSERPDEVASRGWDAALPRIATWLRLLDREAGHELLWLNTHLDHQGTVARHRSAALLHDWLREHQGAAHLVVTGDFNAPADQTPGTAYQALTWGDAHEPLLRDAWAAAAADVAAGTFHGFSGTPGPDRIDWVLASSALTVREATSERSPYGGRWPSDHFPVLGVFALPSPSPRATMLAANLTIPAAFTAAELDSLLRAEQRLPTAERVAAWAWRLAERGGLEYRFGLADGGYVTEGRLAPGRRHDCISLVYRTTELARARSAAHALEVALATRFAGAPPDEVIADDGRVDYDHPAHLDYSVDMIRSGHWGTDVTAEFAGATPDHVGSSRYPAGTITVVPQQRLDPSDLRDGDVAWLVFSADDPGAAALRRDHGLMVGHAGVVVLRKGEPWLVHAASRPLPGWYDTTGVVAVPLASYLQRVERYDALIVTRYPSAPEG